MWQLLSVVPFKVHELETETTVFNMVMLCMLSYLVQSTVLLHMINQTIMFNLSVPAESQPGLSNSLHGYASVAKITEALQGCHFKAAIHQNVLYGDSIKCLHYTMGKISSLTPMALTNCVLIRETKKQFLLSTCHCAYSTYIISTSCST